MTDSLPAYNPGAGLRFECFGCGHCCTDPQADIEDLRARGFVSCCPSRRMVEDQTKTAAIAAWNRRSLASEQAEVVGKTQGEQK